MADTFDTKLLLEELKRIELKPNQKRIHSQDYQHLGLTQHKALKDITKAHIESFNFMTEEGLQKGIKNLQPVEFLIDGDKIKVQVVDIVICNPSIHKDCVARTRALYPSECRMRNTSYKGKLQLTFSWTKNGKLQEIFDEIVGEIPIMVKSNRCNLEKFGPKQMVEKYEDGEELGGYFIINGKERIVRFLTVQRRNYPVGLTRKSWKESGKIFTEFGVSMRSIRDDQTGNNNILHYLNDGTVRLKFFHQNQPSYLPLVMILKALCDVSDRYIYDKLMRGKEEDIFYKGSVLNMLRLVVQEGLTNQQQIKNYIGERFRIRTNLPDWKTDEEVCDYVLKYCVAVNFTNNVDKFNALVEMTKKLFGIARGTAAIENPDNPMFHELLMSGHLYFGLLLDRLQNFLYGIKTVALKNMETVERGGKTLTVSTATMRRWLAMKFGEIVRPMETIISTGNLASKSMGIQQNTGLSVMAEKINFWRFLSHFKSVHRGSFFSEMKTTACRKLYPEAWGFLCPVHTPDGSPCGLLNHMTEMCHITNNQPSLRNLQKTLLTIGMDPYDGPPLGNYGKCYVIQLDGKVVGYVDDKKANGLVNELRTLKANGKLPPLMEIALVPKSDYPTHYPGVFMFTTPARMMRPVFNRTTGTIEMIGTFEQVYMDISVNDDEVIPEVTTHTELRENGFLSVLASQIPYPDFNQSPRNMYSCQMGKQTMGTPSHTLRFRSDQKMYQILSPQSPLVRPWTHDHYRMDDYPYGTNAVVAVISYTGFDMEDALILNKASVERGFKDGSIIKTQIVDLREMGDVRGNEIVYIFGRKTDTEDEKLKNLDADGLPYIGTKVEYQDAICSYIELATGQTKIEKYKYTEVAFVTAVKILARDNGKDPMQTVAISFHIPRRPTIGDKFANRHGQKGVCSFLWPQENMPFTGNGLTPDIIFNPHGFPSRMTIGMMFESMAGKSASMHGLVHDATPFTFSEENTASEYFGRMLEECGYNYYGTERMYSGIDGRELKADIFMGVIYYIRLRHMVGDKFQVRSTGPIDQLTHQPIKGRKKGGGVRFGEMERDSLLAHGAAFLLHDRLFNNSDKTMEYGCKKCGSLISPQFVLKPNYPKMGPGDHSNRMWVCSTCGSREHITPVIMPFVLKYLVAELAAVNIRSVFDFEN